MAGTEDMNGFVTIDWHQGRVRMLDQRLLPQEEVYRHFDSAAEVADAIRQMVIRGAPAIGCAAAFGLAVEAQRLAREGIPGDWSTALTPGYEILATSRPTAVNLMWALKRMQPLITATPAAELPARLLAEAEAIHREDVTSCRAMGHHGALILPDTGDRPITIMTHCNAGALATAGYGTALGVIRGAVALGRQVRVITNETRPFWQGARLTAWELVKDGIDTTLATDNMVGHLMSLGLVDAVVVGADRVAANGDAANKIGTYTVAVLAARHDVPFYVACPLSTIDLNTPTGAGIPIEERPTEEVTHCRGQRIAALGVKVRNPAFDVTPAGLITALVTEKGAIMAPDTAKIAQLFAS